MDHPIHQKKNAVAIYHFLDGKKAENQAFIDIFQEEYGGWDDTESKQLLITAALTSMIKRINLDIHNVYKRGRYDVYDDSYKTSERFGYNEVKKVFMELFNDFGEEVMNGRDWHICYRYLIDDEVTYKLIKMDSSMECSYKIYCDFYMLYFNQLENARDVIMSIFLNQESLRERYFPISNADEIYSKAIRAYVGLTSKCRELAKSFYNFMDLMESNTKKAKAAKNRKKRLDHKAKLVKEKSDKKIKDMLDMARNGIKKRKMFEKKIEWCSGGCGGCVGCWR